MQDINNGIIKLVSSLAVKKYRDKEGLFVAEGWKCVRDTWHAFNCRYLIATRAWYEQQGTAEHYHKIVFANKGQMAKMSQFTTASDVMAVYEIPQVDYTPSEVRGGLNLVLDNIQDPGNLGTIMRLADWYGINNVFASKSNNIYTSELPYKGAFVVFGNEGQGISAKVASHVTQRLHIPAMPRRGAHSESLNVGIAAAITISELCRSSLK